MVAVVDHLPGHAAVDADVLAGDEARPFGAEEQRHVGNVHGIAHAAGRLLDGVRAFVDPAAGVDPAGGDGVDPNPARKADGQGVGKGGDAALGRRVALRLGLAHAVPRGRDVDDSPACAKMVRKQLGEIEGRGDADGEGVLEFLVGAFADALHQRQGVVDEEIHMAVRFQHMGRKPFQRFFFADVADKMVAGRDVDDLDLCALGLKRLRNRFSNAVGAAGDHGHFVFKFHEEPPSKNSSARR